MTPTLRSTTRREFLGYSMLSLLAVPVVPLFASCVVADAGKRKLPVADPPTEGFGAADAPESLSWRTVIAGKEEPGTRMVINGTVFQEDGTTPAPGVLVYAYHTDNNGYYSPNGKEWGNGKRHGHLRGWMLTDERGRYEFESIKPAPYPGRGIPAHVHMTITAPDYPEYWIDEIWFAGDPYITPEELAKLSGRGGFSGIVTLENGHATRNIRLERV